LVTVLQRAENLTDRQAAEAVRTRIDWQYLLGLPFDDPGVDHSVLAEFRARLVEAGLEQVALDALLARLAADGLVTKGGKQRSDSTSVHAAVAALNRLELVGESVRTVLEALAAAHPAWLEKRICVADFTRRYGLPMTSWRPRRPKTSSTAYPPAQSCTRTSGSGEVNRFATNASITCPCVNSDRSSTGHNPSMTSRTRRRAANAATTGNDPNAFSTDGTDGTAHALSQPWHAATDRAHHQPAAPKPTHDHRRAECGTSDDRPNPETAPQRSSMAISLHLSCRSCNSECCVSPVRITLRPLC
jgi:transposase-like protein DUF772